VTGRQQLSSRPVRGTPCDLCGRTLSYRPGQASDVLTAHYKAEHGQYLAGLLQFGQGWEPQADALDGRLAGSRRTAGERERFLRDARDRFGPGTPADIRRKAAAVLHGAGYSAIKIGRVFGVTSTTIGVDLRDTGPVSPGPDAARALVELAGLAEQARQVRQALRDTRDRFGPGTPIDIRREVAAVLHTSLGMSYKEIGAIFGVTATPIQQSQARYRPSAAGRDPAGRIRQLARQAQEFGH
jgi:hypothetical protein